MWHDLWVAFALMLVMEGLMPFLSPQAMKRMLISVLKMDDHALRVAGLISMLAGVLLLYIVN